MAYKQTIATEATDNGNYELAHKQTVAAAITNIVDSYQSVIDAELAKIANPAFEQLDMDVQVFTGIQPTLNSNQKLYFQVKAQNLPSGDTKITVGDRDGSTMSIAYLPMGCGVVMLQQSLGNFNSDGFNKDEQSDFDVQ